MDRRNKTTYTKSIECIVNMIDKKSRKKHDNKSISSISEEVLEEEFKRIEEKYDTSKPIRERAIWRDFKFCCNEFVDVLK